MVRFRIHDEKTAPEGAKPVLEAAKKNFGFVPNLYGVMAESPELLEAYVTLSGLFQKCSLPAHAKHVVWLAASVENGCHYCVAAHSALGLQAGLSPEAVESIRSGKPVSDPALEAVRRLTRAIVARRGWPEESDIEAFLAAGFTLRNLLDVVLGVGMKTLSNYTNHLADTPLDEVFRGQEWKKSA